MPFLKLYDALMNVTIHCEMINPIKLPTSHSGHLAEGEDKWTLSENF